MNIWHHFFKDGSQWKQYNITHFDNLKHLSYWSYACCSKRCCFCFLKKEGKKKIRARVCPPQCVVIDPWRESTLFKFSPPISPTWGRQKQPGFLRFRKLRGNEARGWRLFIVSNAAEQRMVRRSACGFKPCMYEAIPLHCTEYWWNTTNMERWTQEEKGHQQSRAYCPSHFPFDNWIHFYKLKCGHISIWLADFMLHTYWI